MVLHVANFPSLMDNDTAAHAIISKTIKFKKRKKKRAFIQMTHLFLKTWKHSPETNSCDKKQKKRYLSK